jgi:hypothetical protein
MKSKEEINDLAEIHANQEMKVYKSMDLPKGTKQAIFTHCLVSYNIAYTQCQEDMADKKYTLDDIKKAFMSGCASERRFSRRTDELDNYINSLNKQD